MKQPIIDERTHSGTRLDGCLSKDVRWSRATDAGMPWKSQVDQETWAIRLNDFPEEHLYTLFVDDEEIGSFDDWPKPWSKG